MATVVIESTIKMNGREISTISKTYKFEDDIVAQEFIDRLYNLEQGKYSDNLVRAYIIDDAVTVSAEANPLMLHTVYYDHSEEPEDGLRVLEDIDVLTVEEIEEFRTKGIKQNIVFAFENHDSLEPASFEKTEDEYPTRFDLLGANLFSHDPNTEFYLSFRPDISELLLQKFGHLEEENKVRETEETSDAKENSDA